MAKVAKIWDGTAWVDLATSVPDLSNYQLKSEGGLTLVKKQTIGTAVSSVVVTDAFSATYENYKIIVNGGVGSTAQALGVQLGSTTTEYYSSTPILSYGGVVTNLNDNNNSQWTYPGESGTSNNALNIDLLNPFLSKWTTYQGAYTGVNNSGFSGGVQKSTTSFTAFTLKVAGTMTGGTIYVYGYNKG
jgi:hypothetical protein